MVNAPPGRLSTTICWPISLPSSAPRMRATVSVALPAACGTISRIGRSGYSATAWVASTQASRPMVSVILRIVVLRLCSVLPPRLEPEHRLSEHAAGGVPVQADVGGGGVGVAPGALQRVVQVQPLSAGGEEQRVDCLYEQPHAERLVAPV